MLLLSWNVNHFNQEAHLPERIEAIGSKRPDIVTLQEVKSGLADAWQDQLAKASLVHTCWSGNGVSHTLFECLIASRWQVSNGDDRWRRYAPYPDSLGRATVSVPGGDVDVFTAHIPNGSGNGWKKIDTFRVLSAALRRVIDSPRLLTGDFNEPERFRQSGQIVPFHEKVHEDGGTSIWGCHEKFGDERRKIEWTDGVRSVLDGASQHGLRDAYRDVHGGETPTPVTHYTTGGNPRCFDHAFVSRHFEVLDCCYYHECRLQPKLSDHSAMWTRLRFRTDLLPLEQWESDG